MESGDSTKRKEFEDFLAEAKPSGGSELANYQLFVERLCGHLNLPGPDLAQEANERNDYVFERRVDFKHGDGRRLSIQPASLWSPRADHEMAGKLLRGAGGSAISRQNSPKGH